MKITHPTIKTVFAMTIAIGSILMLSSIARAQTLNVNYRPARVRTSADPIGLDGYCPCEGSGCNSTCEFSAHSDWPHLSATATIKGPTMVATFNSVFVANSKTLLFKENYILDKDTAKTFGYKSITILKGRYAVGKGQTVTLRIQSRK